MSNLRDAVGLRVPYGKPDSHYQTEFEPATEAIWAYMNPKDGTPCCSLGLLHDALDHDRELVANGARVEIDGVLHSVHYYVTASRVPGVYNLGGDLALFSMLIRTRDREALSRYATLCVDHIYPRTQGFFSPTLTKIALVQGDALGGGFECALASDLIVAEEGAQMGLPEILFNLFPGMGACSLLARRIGTHGAEQLILSGELLPAERLHEIGVVDVLAKPGEGEAAVQNWIVTNAKRRNGMQAVLSARRLVHPVTREELDGIVKLWVDAALRLGERDLKMMNRLARAQMRRMECARPVAPTLAAFAGEALAAAV